MKSADRAEHVGSLLRPPELLQARAAFAEKRLNQEQLKEAEDRAILDALAKQTAAGLDRITDGEFRRGSWLTDMADAVEGFVRDRVVLDWKGPGGGPDKTPIDTYHRVMAMLAHGDPATPKSDLGVREIMTEIRCSAGFASVCRHRPLDRSRVVQGRLCPLAP